MSETDSPVRRPAATSNQTVADAPRPAPRVGDKPVGGKPVREKPVGDKPVGEKPVGGKPAARKRWMLSTVVLLAVIGAGWYGWHALVGAHYEQTDNAYVGGHVVQVTPQVPGSIVAISADDNDYVQAGQALVRLDPADAKLAVDEARAALAQAVREVRTLYVANDSINATIRAREADVQRANSEVSRLQGDLERRSALLRSGAVSSEELAHLRDQISSARSAAAAAQAAVVQSREQLNSARSLTDDTVIATHPNVQRAASKLREALLAQSRTEILAPVTGYVVRRNAQLGQRAQPGQPLLSIAMLGSVWVDANFKEVQLRDMRIGQPVQLSADQYGSDVVFHGRIVGMGAGTGAAFSILPAQNATGNWIKVVQRVPVRIELDPAELKEHPLRIGLSMLAKVDIADQSGPMIQTMPAAPMAETMSTTHDVTTAADAAVRDIIQRNSASQAASATSPAKVGLAR